MEQSAKAAAARRGVKLDMDGTDAAASREKKVLSTFPDCAPVATGTMQLHYTGTCCCRACELFRAERQRHAAPSLGWHIMIVDQGGHPHSCDHVPAPTERVPFLR
jgi:hypothetical protein